MKKIYIFFFETPFKTGKAIRFLTRNKYNHVAFSFAPNTRRIYSYSRYRYHEPFLSGFGVENTDRYYKCGGAVDIRVCEYPVSDALYRRIKRTVAKYRDAQKLTRYNFADLIAYPFKHHIHIEYTHTCLSFLCEAIEREDIRTIGQLERATSDMVIYEGSLDGFERKPTTGDIDFFERRARRVVYAASAMVMLSQTGQVLRKLGEDIIEHIG